MDRSGSASIPLVVIDVWMKHLLPSQFRLVLMLLRQGYHGREGLPASERYRLADWLGLTREVAYRSLNELTRMGAVSEWPHRTETCYAVNTHWMPPAQQPSLRKEQTP